MWKYFRKIPYEKLEQTISEMYNERKMIDEKAKIIERQKKQQFQTSTNSKLKMYKLLS